MIKKKSFLSFLVVWLALFSGSPHAEFQFNLPPPATVVAHQIYDLHTLILLVCLAIFIVVFGAMFYSLYKHRKSLGHKPAQFHQNKTVEIIWTIIPCLILVGMAYPATKVILDMKDTSASDISIKVTGHQWKWEYEYMGEGVRFISSLSTPQSQIDNQMAKDPHYLLETDRPLVVPTGKKVRLLLTANDVIHSWWIPQFGVKQDAIPGFIKEAWIRVDNPGTYRGQCAELCGVGHGFMPIVVEAMPPEKYTAWLEEQKASVAAAAAASGKTYMLAELMARGEQVYAANCALCHQAKGQGMAGAFPPLIGGAPFAAPEQLTAPLAERGFWKDGKIVLGSKEKHLDIVMHGIPGSAMQAFGKQLSDFDIAAVVTYERNSWGNQAGDMIQPTEVAEVRN